MAEEDRRTTPYSYTFDDPIRHTDPDGMFGEDANDESEGNCCDGPSTSTKVTAGGIMGGGMALAGTIAVGGLATGPGEAVALPAAGVVVLGTLAGAGFMWVMDKAFSSHSNSAEPDHLNGGTRLSPDKIKSPPTKPGNAPIGLDGHPIELHHRNQGDPNSPLDELSRTDHRKGENYKKNHPNTNQKRSNIDRNKHKQQKENHWKKETESRRFDPEPELEHESEHASTSTNNK